MNFKVRFLTVVMAALMAAVLSSAQVQAQAWEWAKRLPINQYSPEDIKILKQSMVENLGTLEDGAPGEWSNPETGHGGSITPPCWRLNHTADDRTSKWQTVPANKIHRCFWWAGERV